VVFFGEREVHAMAIFRRTEGGGGGGAGVLGGQKSPEASRWHSPHAPKKKKQELSISAGRREVHLRGEGKEALENFAKIKS